MKTFQKKKLKISLSLKKNLKKEEKDQEKHKEKEPSQTPSKMKFLQKHHPKEKIIGNIDEGYKPEEG